MKVIGYEYSVCICHFSFSIVACIFDAPFRRLRHHVCLLLVLFLSFCSSFVLLSWTRLHSQGKATAIHTTKTRPPKYGKRNEVIFSLHSYETFRHKKKGKILLSICRSRTWLTAKFNKAQNHASSVFITAANVCTRNFGFHCCRSTYKQIVRKYSAFSCE